MTEEKLKVLFISDLVVETGFSTVAHNIINNIKDEFDVTGLGVNYFGDPHEMGFPIYPAISRNSGNIYGLDRAVNLINAFDYDIVFILNDSWVISYYLDMFKKHLNKEKKLPKIVVYFPVDSLAHDPDWYRDFDIVSEAVTYTNFGVRVVKQASPNLTVKVIPHGVESKDFFKAYENRTQSRLELFGEKRLNEFGNPEDLFIVLNANRNQPRKRLDITFAGFSLFAKNKPKEVKLYMHSGVMDSSVNLVKQSRRYGIEQRLILSTLNPGLQMLPVERLNILYNACDIGVNTSMGEGWGLTNVEHAVTGAVQVVPRHSACEELFNDCGLLMETITNFTFDNSETVGRLTTPQELARCLEILYRNKDLRSELSEKSMKKFQDPIYQWKNIAQTWKELFIEVSKKDATFIPHKHEGDNRTDNTDGRETSNV